MNTFLSPVDAAKNGNSTTNQAIKQKFVGNEVYCNVNSLAEFALRFSEELNQDAPFSFDDIENYYTYPEYRGHYADFNGGTKEELDAEVERLQELQETIGEDEGGTDYISLITAEIEALEALDSEPAEIFEWWAVSYFLFNQLKAYGAPVVDAGSCYLWGRTTTGQAILLDYCITQICAEMGILDGQENSWTPYRFATIPAHLIGRMIHALTDICTQYSGRTPYNATEGQRAAMEKVGAIIQDLTIYGVPTTDQ